MRHLSSLCGVRDDLIVDFDHIRISSSSDTILQSSLELQMTTEPVCALGTESLLETTWKEMAISYLIYTLCACGKYRNLRNISVFLMFVAFFLQCSKEEATLMMFFSIIVTYVHTALCTISATELLPFISGDIYEPPIMCQTLGYRRDFDEESSFKEIT